MIVIKSMLLRPSGNKANYIDVFPISSARSHMRFVSYQLVQAVWCKVTPLQLEARQTLSIRGPEERRSNSAATRFIVLCSLSLYLVFASRPLGHSLQPLHSLYYQNRKVVKKERPS